MPERVVYLNGQHVAERDAKVSVLDRGFRWGDAVYDATRTFDLYQAEEALGDGTLSWWGMDIVAEATRHAG